MCKTGVNTQIDTSLITWYSFKYSDSQGVLENIIALIIMTMTLVNTLKWYKHNYCQSWFFIHYWSIILIPKENVEYYKQDRSWEEWIVQTVNLMKICVNRMIREWFYCLSLITICQLIKSFGLKILSNCNYGNKCYKLFLRSNAFYIVIMIIISNIYFNTKELE